MVILADSTGEELRAMSFDTYDFDLNDKKADFEISMLLSDWQDIPNGARIFIPGTEFGGLFSRLETDTKTRTIAAGGFTWRGMLRNRVIIPPSGEDYATDTGDINDIIRARVEEAYDGLFTGAAPAGVTVNYQYKRYCTLYDGLTDMLATVGYKPRIKYNQELKRVVVDAVPIVDYSKLVEFSSDMTADYHVIQDRGGVNHLICLGVGQLAERTVVHLYTDRYGNISQTQTFTGTDEIVQVYDYSSADEAQLITSGTDQLKMLRARNDLSMDVDGQSFEIGDIVGGRDYITGITMRAKVIGILRQSKNGIETTEYTISDVMEE